MANPYEVLKERGFLKQETRPDEEAVRKLFEEEKEVICYIGFDGTASSLHCGSLLPIMALMHIEKNGHKPLVLIGGATTLVGDPSGKQEMRKMLAREKVTQYGEAIERQISHYLGTDSAIYENNYDWFKDFQLIEFLRDIGSKFTVSEMLTSEAYKIRMETGLSFLEFSYQLFQAYDFLHLYEKHGCKVQMGGDDQWGNIVAGVDLVRKKAQTQVEGMTFPLLETAGGAKMGKTEAGAVWLDPEMTSPYDFYQYWVNTDDRDVERFLKLFTFLPLEKIEDLTSVEGAEINKAKQVLAFEATKITHGEEEAKKAQKAAKALFYGKGETKAGMPTHNVKKSRLEEGLSVLDAFAESGLTSSKSQARRTLKQGGLYVNDETVEDIQQIITLDDLDEDGEVMLRFGKKKHCRLIPVEE